MEKSAPLQHAKLSRSIFQGVFLCYRGKKVVSTQDFFQGFWRLSDHDAVHDDGPQSALRSESRIRNSACVAGADWKRVLSTHLSCPSLKALIPLAS